MEVTTEHQKWPKISTKSVNSSFFARWAKKASAEGRSPPQELEGSPRSGLYLLVEFKRNNFISATPNLELISLQNYTDLTKENALT